MEHTVSIINLLLILLIGNYKLVLSEEILDGGYIKTCSRPMSPENSVISYLAAPRRYPDDTKNGGYGVDGYQEHDKVYFQCKEGFSQTSHPVMYITCGSNGKWFPEVENLGKCIPNRNFHKCKHGLFRCKTSRKCISDSKRCDCTNDCSDGSDEVDCNVRRKSIHATTEGSESSGIISSPGYPRTYPKFSCIYHISTVKGHHVEIDFEEFDLPEKTNDRCFDFVRVLGLHSKSVSHTPKNIRKKRKNKILSETKCGKRAFKRVFSEFMHITVNVSIGQHSTLTRHRGFTLSWHVRSKEYLNQIISTTVSPIDKPDDESSSEESIYTILIPIVISALLPLSLITFLCCHRHLRRRCSRKKSDHDSNAIEIDVANHEPTLSLTENNLALFEGQLQNHHQIDKPDENEQQQLNQTESDEFSRKNNVNSTTPCDCRCCIANSRNSNNSRKDIGDKLNRDSYSSHQSEIPRYVMSYDVPRRHSPMSSQLRHGSSIVNDSSHCVTPEHMKRSTRINKPYNSSPHLNNSLPTRGRHARSTRDILRHSYHSQSTNSCKLCNHHKSMRKLENHYKHKHQLDEVHPVNGDFSEYPSHSVNEDFIEYPHPVNEDFNEYSHPADEDINEYRHPVNEDFNDFNKYPHPVDDYPDDRYPSVEKFHEYTHPVNNEYHLKNTSFYEYAPNTNNSVDIIYDNQFYHMDSMNKDCDMRDSLSYTEPHQTRVLYIEKTYGPERFVNTIAYNTKRGDDFYDTHSFNTNDRTSGSLICTH